jgi:hypothetical protein
MTGAAALGAPASAPMQLGAATQFAQGRDPSVVDQAFAFGVTDFRDGMRWNEVETAPGAYSFDAATTAYPDWILSRGGTVSLTINWGNRFYDDGATPHSDAAHAAQARYITALLDRFPEIDTIEIGNEYNGNDFVNGPVLKDGYGKRAAHYVRMLDDVAARVRRLHPDVTVLGGATHSIPVGYYENLFTKGAAPHMDGIALHPYTTPPEQLQVQLAALRSRFPLGTDLPIHVTEFGSTDPESAPDYVAKMLAVMSAADVRRAVWYPLKKSGNEKSVPLLRRDGTPTSAGEAWRFVGGLMAETRAEDVSPDAFTYAYRLGDRALVIWGEPRLIEVDDDVVVQDATGRVLGAPERIDPERVLVLTARNGIALGDNVRLGRSRLLADSYHQFGYPGVPSRTGDEDPFVRGAHNGRKPIPFEMKGGGETNGVVWTPYLGNSFTKPMRIGAKAMVPGVAGQGERRREIRMVHRYTADRDQVVDIRSSWQPSKRTKDGVTVRIRSDDAVLFEESTAVATRADLGRVRLRKGQSLTFDLLPNRNAQGDATRYRIQIFETTR